MIQLVDTNVRAVEKGELIQPTGINMVLDAQPKRLGSCVAAKGEGATDSWRGQNTAGILRLQQVVHPRFLQDGRTPI